VKKLLEEADIEIVDISVGEIFRSIERSMGFDDINVFIGYLEAHPRVAARVVRWLTRDNIVTAAKVVKITGGTRRQPRLGCVLELSTYPGPEKKNKTARGK